jgi:hypothetical protein
MYQGVMMSVTSPFYGMSLIDVCQMVHAVIVTYIYSQYGE